MIKYAVLTFALIVFSIVNVSADVIIDSINYKIEINDFSGAPGSYVKMPVKIKNAMEMGGFLFRFEYDSSIMKPVAISDEVSGAVFDSLEIVGRGLNTIYEQSNGDTVSSIYAFHPVNDPIDPNTIFIQYISPLAPYDNYIDIELGEPSIICYLLFEIMPYAQDGETAEIFLTDYDGPEPYYRHIQLSDTLGSYIIYPGSGPIYDVAIFTGEPALCGDIDSSGSINMLDILALIDFLYNNGSTPNPLNIADVDGNGSVNLLDAIYLISYLYLSGTAPDCP